MSNNESAHQMSSDAAEVVWPSHCYRCGAKLPKDSHRCPNCGRRQIRYCYCGNAIPVTAAKCPYCGADWSAAIRVRRKSRSSRWDWRMFAAYCAAGGLATVAAAAAVNSLVGALALRSLPPGQTGLPGAFSARLALALTTIGRTISRIGSKVVSIGGGPWVAPAVVGTGICIGALLYMRRVGKLRLKWPFRKKRVYRRRRQGVY